MLCSSCVEVFRQIKSFRDQCRESFDVYKQRTEAKVKVEEFDYHIPIESIEVEIKEEKVEVDEQSGPKKKKRRLPKDNSSQEPLTCDLCLESFNSKKLLTTHMKYHQSIIQFSCETCNAKFKTKSLLRSHIKRMHQSVLNVSCEHCPRMFKSKGDRSTHVRRNHTDKFCEFSLGLLEILIKSFFFVRFSMSQSNESLEHGRVRGAPSRS